MGAVTGGFVRVFDAFGPPSFSSAVLFSWKSEEEEEEEDGGSDQHQLNNSSEGFKPAF